EPAPVLLIALRPVSGDQLPGLLPVLQCEPNPPQEVIHVVAVPRVAADGNRDTQAPAALPEVEACRPDSRGPLHAQPSALGRTARRHDEEPVACEARDEIIRRRALPQAARSFPQYVVTDTVTERGIDLAHVA